MVRFEEYQMADHEVETMKAIILGAILDFGSIAPSLAAELPGAIFSSGLTRDIDLFTVRVNYKFGGREVARF